MRTHTLIIDMYKTNDEKVCTNYSMITYYANKIVTKSISRILLKYYYKKAKIEHALIKVRKPNFALSPQSNHHSFIHIIIYGKDKN